MLLGDVMERLEPVRRVYSRLVGVWNLDGVIESDAMVMAMLCVGRRVEMCVAECRKVFT